MDSEKIYEMHIIKAADTTSPSIHTFPIDAEALPANITLQHLRTLTSEQLSFLSAHLSRLNDKVAAEAAARPPNPVACNETHEEDFETPWALEGIEVDVEPETVFRSATQGVRRPGRSEKKDVMGVKTWKPTPGVQKDIVAVYSRLICCRGYRRGFGANVYNYARAQVKGAEEVWKVSEEIGGGIGKAPVTVVERRGGYRSDSEDEIIV